MQEHLPIPTGQVYPLAARSTVKSGRRIESSRKRDSSWKVRIVPAIDCREDQSFADFAGVHAAVVAAAAFAEAKVPLSSIESRLAEVVCTEKRIQWAARSFGRVIGCLKFAVEVAECWE